MKHMLQICCKNNNIYKEFPIGSSLLDIYYGFNLNFPYQVVSAKVNNRSEGLNFRVYNNKDVESLDTGCSTNSFPSGNNSLTALYRIKQCERTYLRIPEESLTYKN